MIQFISRNKTIVAFGLIVLILINLIAHRYFYLSQNRLLNKLYQRGSRLTLNFAEQIGNSLLNNDTISLKAAIENLENTKNVYFIEILDSQDKIVARADFKGEKLEYQNIENRWNIGKINGVEIETLTIADNNQVIRFSANVEHSDINIGNIFLTLSTNPLNVNVKKHKIIFISLLFLSVLLLVLCLYLVHHMSKTVAIKRQKEQESLTRIGPYILVEKIGEGGMAQLYKAEHTSKDGFLRIVALKKILPLLTQNQEFKDMFIREARIVAFLRHPNIVQITDYGKSQNAYYIAMEYVDGINLAQIMDRIHAGFPIDFAVFLALKIITGLQYAHSKRDDKSGAPLNIVHRDITPHNVMVSFEGEVKITDFGLAKARSEPNLTKTGQIKGKQQYMSPEQALGQKVDNRTDLYAFGIVCYEILSGRQLFKLDTEMNIIGSISANSITPLNTIRSDIPDELNRIVFKCLKRNKNERYQTAQEIFHELLHFKKKFNLAFDSTNLSDFMKQYLNRTRLEAG